MGARELVEKGEGVGWVKVRGISTANGKFCF